MRKLILGSLICSPTLAWAQSGSDGLTGSFDDICASAVAGTPLFDRCQEIQNSPNLGAFGLSAAGQRLEELPAQGRAGTRNQQQTDIISEDFANGWSLFLSADLGRLDRSISANEAAFDGNANRFTAGLNYQASPKWLLGLALNHQRENLNFKQSDSRNRSTMNGALLTANFAPADNFNFDAYYGQFNGSADNLRNIAYSFEKEPGVVLTIDAQALASPDVKRDIAGIGGAWLWNKNAWSGDISLAYDHSKTRLDAYNETGGIGFALEVPKRSIQSKTGALAFTVSRTISTNWGVLVPSARLGFRKEFDNPQRQLSVQFVQDTTNTNISFVTADPDTQWGEVGIGVSLVMKKGHQAFFQYRQRFAHSFLQERTVALGWRMEF